MFRHTLTSVGDILVFYYSYCSLQYFEIYGVVGLEWHRNLKKWQDPVQISYLVRMFRQYYLWFRFVRWITWKCIIGYINIWNSDWRIWASFMHGMLQNFKRACVSFSIKIQQNATWKIVKLLIMTFLKDLSHKYDRWSFLAYPK